VEAWRPSKGLPMPPTRDATIDALRGLAVFTMIPANMSALVYAEPHDFWFRVSGTFAAPLFVLLAGYMAAANSTSKRYDLRYYLVRGAMVLAVAALIDLLVWRVLPLMTCDVLYLIGMSMPLVYLFRRIPSRIAQWGLVLLVFAAGPVLQLLLGYTDYPTEYYWIRSEQLDPVANPSGVLNHFLVDGWFPIFPWLAFALLGSLLADLRHRTTTAIGLGRWAWPAGAALLALGLAVWWYQPGAMLVREGYSELFFPPTTGFLITSVGVAVLLFALADLRPGLVLLQPLRLLGEAALLMYIVHLALIQYLISGLWEGQTLGRFLIIDLVFTILLVLLGLGVRKLKGSWGSRPMVARFVLGG